jgi:hypothetical protein
MALSTTTPLHRDPTARRGFGHLLVRAGQALVRMSRTGRALDVSYEACHDRSIIESLRSLRAADIAATGGLGFEEWQAVRVSSVRNDAARERADMAALGELVDADTDDALHVYGLLLRSADRLAIASLSSLTVKFWSVLSDGRLVIHSAMTPHGRAAWTQRLLDMGMSRREIDRALPLHDIDDDGANIVRIESVKPLSAVWEAHHRMIVAETRRGNPARALDTFETYAALACRERMHA